MDVELSVNTWEATYRRVLSPGFFPSIEGQNQRRFARRVAVVNNVHDPGDARERADALLARKEVDEVVWVERALDAALARAGLSRHALGPFPHYTDWAIVSVMSSTTPMLLQWDACVELARPFDWVGPALELMREHADVLVANPSWNDPGLEREFDRVAGDFGLGYGFSDQLFLCKCGPLQDAVYGYARSCPAVWRYPLSAISPIFEARVDAYMRTRRLMRATHRGIVYRHSGEGRSHPPLPLRARASARARHILLSIMNSLPLHDPRFRTRGFRAHTTR